MTRIPKQSFWIWFTPRTGSTFLCKSLEGTGIAGKAGEFLNLQDGVSLQEHYDIQTYDDLKSRFWEMGMSKNGVMGMKYSLYHKSYEALCGEVKQLIGRSEVQQFDWSIWEDIFPNCQHVFISRRNKLRLVVSWWKAIQDHQWHRLSGEAPKEKASFYEDKYNADALKHLLKDHCLREAMTQEYFKRNGIKPYSIVYEDFVGDYEFQLRKLLNHMGLDGNNSKIPEHYYSPTADDTSEVWVERFRHDLQDGWDHPVW